VKFLMLSPTNHLQLLCIITGTSTNTDFWLSMNSKREQ
jgi:hypothetical protein